ncbi:MAG: hypothetical protein AB7I41_18375 [Candidatus Sericytochromatia bacterium]
MDVSLSAGTNALKRVESTGFALPRSTRPAPPDPYDFQQALAFFLRPPQGSVANQSQDNESLLTINPNLNLKLITRLHPGASLVHDQGRTRLEIADAPPKAPELMVSDQNVMQWAQFQTPKPPEALHNQPVFQAQSPDLAFGRTLAPSGLSALFMGQGVARGRSLAPESLNRLLQGRIPPPPVDANTDAERLANDLSHWQMAA